MRWRFFVSEAFNSIRGNVATTVAASVTVLIVTFLLAVFASLGLFLYDKTVGVRNDVTVKAYMKMGTEDDTATLNKIRNALVLYRELRQADGAEFRFHTTILYNSIYRADDQLLVNTHVYGMTAARAPVWHLKKVAGGEIAGTYLESFERVWESAVPVPGE